LSFQEYVPLVATILPFLAVIIGKRFERKEKTAADLSGRFAQIEERLDIAELKLARMEGRLNGSRR